MSLTPREFSKIASEFIATQDDTCEDEWYCTDATIAEEILSRLRVFLFGDIIAKESRRSKYEELKKEFEPKLIAARSPQRGKTTRMKS